MLVPITTMDPLLNNNIDLGLKLSQKMVLLLGLIMMYVVFLQYECYVALDLCGGIVV
jgi:hypothetical protein